LYKYTLTQQSQTLDNVSARWSPAGGPFLSSVLLPVTFMDQKIGTEGELTLGEAI